MIIVAQSQEQQYRGVEAKCDGSNTMAIALGRRIFFSVSTVSVLLLVLQADV